MIINMNGAKAPETPSPVMQEKTVTPETLPTVIGADEGYDGLSQVTVNPDAQLKAENIRSGKTIFGVAGAFVGEPYPVADAEALFWQSCHAVDTDSPTINAPAGTITATSISQPIIGCTIGSEGVDMSSVTYVWSGLMAECRQEKYDKVYIKVSVQDTYVGAVFEYCRMTNLPEGNWKAVATMFSRCVFKEDLVLKDEYFPDGFVPNQFLNAVCKAPTLPSYHPTGLTVTVPASVTKVGNYGLSFEYSYKGTLKMLGSTPPELAFDNSIDCVSRIIVPQGSLSAYQTANRWSRFAGIMEEAQ